MSDPHENADRLREKLLEQDRTLAGNLHRGHTRAWFKIRKRLESLAKEQDTARAQKETTDLV